ncbi:MAG: hypothetical protein MUD11_10205 [Rhodobacteraceae bacterium]|nr:hypothetical protein [Paracoccaceae bacterium]
MFGDAGNDLVSGIDLIALGPNEFDRLFGGQGDDTLIGDDGDHLFGNAGADDYVLFVNAADASDDWVRIYDFAPGTDQLRIEVAADITSTDVTLTAGPNGSLRVAVGNTIFAVLEGTLAASVQQGDIVVTRAA